MSSLPTSSCTTLVLRPHERFGLELLSPPSGVVTDGLLIQDVTNPHFKPHVQPNDVLASINGVPFHGLRWDKAIELLQTTPRPYALTFAHSLASTQLTPNKREPPSYIAVVARGVHFADAAMHGIDGAAVHHLTYEAKAGGILAAGDLLYKVGETTVLYRPYSAVMDVVAKATSPCVLRLIPHALVADVVRSTLPARAPVRLASLNSSVVPEVVANPALVDANVLHKIHGSLKEGQLYRQGVLFKFWHSRFFVLTPTALLCFASPRSPAPRRELTFAGRRCSVQSLHPTKKFGSVAVVHLLRVCVDRKHIVLACATESDKTAWMTALQHAMTAAQSIPNAPLRVMAAA